MTRVSARITHSTYPGLKVGDVLKFEAPMQSKTMAELREAYLRGDAEPTQAVWTERVLRPKRGVFKAVGDRT